MAAPECYWNQPTDTILTGLSSGTEGLTGDEAGRRLLEEGPNSLSARSQRGMVWLFLQQFKSPITLLLIVSALLSYFLGEHSDAFIILVILLLSAILGFYQKNSAANALRHLLSLVQVNTPTKLHSPVRPSRPRRNAGSSPIPPPFPKRPIRSSWAPTSSVGRRGRSSCVLGRGIRRFGYLQLEVTLLLVIVIFAVNVFLHKPVYMTNAPHRINLRFIRRFMIVFGLISSVFDYVTFWVLLQILHAGPAEFRTGWFIESVVSAAMIILVVRTNQPFYKTRPGKCLLISTIAVVLLIFVIPYTPLAAPLGFIALPPRFYPWLAAIILAYLVSAETAKRLFYKKGTENCANFTHVPHQQYAVCPARLTCRCQPFAGNGGVSHRPGI